MSGFCEVTQSSGWIEPPPGIEKEKNIISSLWCVMYLEAWLWNITKLTKLGDALATYLQFETVTHWLKLNDSPPGAIPTSHWREAKRSNREEKEKWILFSPVLRREREIWKRVLHYRGEKEKWILFSQDSRGERGFLPGLLKSFPFLQSSANHIVTAKALEKVKVYSVRIVILAAMHIMPTTFTYQSIPTSWDDLVRLLFQVLFFVLLLIVTMMSLWNMKNKKSDIHQNKNHLIALHCNFGHKIASQHCFGLPCCHYQPLLGVFISKIVKIEKRKGIVFKNVINRD